MASEEGNAREGLVSEDVAQKYMRAYEEREAKIRGHLEEAEDLFAQADKLTEESLSENESLIVHLEVRGIRAQVQAILTSLQIGERDPEGEPS